MPIKYIPPSTRDLADLKRELNKTGKQMADLFWLAGDHQWRKYTGGEKPREMSPHMSFVAAAKLSLSDEEFARVISKMAEFGAQIAELSPGELQP